MKTKVISCAWTNPKDENDICVHSDGMYCQNPYVHNIKDCKDSGYIEYIDMGERVNKINNYIRRRY